MITPSHKGVLGRDLDPESDSGGLRQDSSPPLPSEFGLSPSVCNIMEI